jgi:hypothetical protein
MAQKVIKLEEQAISEILVEKQQSSTEVEPQATTSGGLPTW